MTDSTGRRVTANLSLTLDGRYHGPGGPGDMGAIVSYATTEVARRHLTRIWESATTAVLGRLNAEGFLGFWPTVAADENADPRDRGYAKWLVDAEKVVFSTTLTEAQWERTRVVNAPAADVVADLKSTGSGDILVNSISMARQETGEPGSRRSTSACADVLCGQRRDSVVGRAGLEPAAKGL